MANEHPPTLITFEPQQVLRRNGLILEADDFTPSSLRDFVDSNEGPITAQIENIHAARAKRAPEPHLVQRETILIARLAIRGQEQRALSWGAFHNPQSFYDTPGDLNDTFKPYWAHLSETAFKPRIRNRSKNNDTDTTGIWLGVTLP